MQLKVRCSLCGTTLCFFTTTQGSGNGNAESRSYLEKKLVFCFRSHIAAQMLLPFGEENLLSSSELMQAQEIATRMVIQYRWGPDDCPAIYHHSNAVFFFLCIQELVMTCVRDIDISHVPSKTSLILFSLIHFVKIGILSF
ncbi:hypothetical protein ABKV19_016313 [Rosa sericea]